MSVVSTKFVHVAGTNGKGSVCAFIEHGLVAAGFSVGKFTSPHVCDVSERITVNGTPISHNDLERLHPNNRKVSEFENLMEAALLYFAENHVDYAVIETGIGGLLDCTNKSEKITPIISVITKIGLDHTDLLGGTIEEIAAHKAGIIKHNIPVVTDPDQPETAMRVIRETAAKMNSPLFVPELESTSKLKMLGKHQRNNAAVAEKTLRILGVDSPKSLDFSQVALLGRLQVVSQSPTRPTIIVDGGHNADAVKAALETVDSLYGGKKTVVIFGMLKSKDYGRCAELLKNRDVIFTDDFSENAVRFDGSVGFSAAIQKARTSVGGDGVILICGSLYLAGYALEFLDNLLL